MQALLNLTIIILAFAGVVLIKELPEKLYLKNAKKIRIGDFKSEHPALFWLIPLMAIAQIIFGVVSLSFTTYLLGDWLETIGNFVAFFWFFSFWLGMLFPRGIVESVFGFSVFPVNQLIKFISVSTGENIRKCGLVRILSYFALMAIIILIYFFEVERNV